MKQKVFLLLLTLLVFCFCHSVFPSSLEELAGPEHVLALLAGENPVQVQSRNPRPQLLPRHQFSRGLIETVLLDLQPNIMVETLHIYEKPGPAAAWSADEKTRLYNNLLALSTLTGLQYFSASRGVMRTFYETSIVIDNPSRRTPLPDPLYQIPAMELTVYARQRDLTFGDNIYQYDYYFIPDGLIFIQQNLTSLRSGIITAVPRNNLRSVVAVLDAGNYILVYAASMANTASFPGMRDRIGNSFVNRAEAIFNWFNNQADKAFNQ
jgi:hypothetical protein